MFNLSAKEFSDKYYCKELKTQSNNYYRLDCESGEGLINSLLKELEQKFLTFKKSEERKQEFEFYLEFFLRKCININRSFSDAVEFLSIWLKISPDTLLSALKTGDLVQFFNRTEFGHDGDKWCFPKLLQIFVILVKDKQVQAKEILDYLFEIFNFFNIPDMFVCRVIGYDQLEKRIKEIPEIFATDFLLKINSFIQINNRIYLGFSSHQYLKEKLQTIDPTLSAKETDLTKLASHLKSTLFNFPSINHFDPSKQDSSYYQFRVGKSC